MITHYEDGELTPEQKKAVQTELYPYGLLENAAFNLAADLVNRNLNDVSPIYRQIIDELKERFEWIPNINETSDDENKSEIWRQADTAIKTGVQEAIEEFEKETEITYTLDEDDADDVVSPLEGLLQLPINYEYLPPVKVLVVLSKIAPSNKRDFYNAIQRLREEKGWKVESAGRDQGYHIKHRPDLGGEIDQLARLAKRTDFETLKRAIGLLESSLNEPSE